MNKLMHYLQWSVRIIITIIFLLSSSGKFDLQGNMSTNFAHWGYPIYMLLTVGIMEAIGAIFLLIRRTLKTGATLLAIVMFGAIYTHVNFYSELGFPFLNILILLGLGLVLYSNRVK